MNVLEAKETIQRMYKGNPTTNQLEALKIAYAALDKRLPMEVTDIHVDEYYCPACGAENNCDNRIVGDKYCPECGQAIDWSEED